MKTFSDLSRLKTFKERYEYLRLDGKVCEDTFGFDRYLNQRFYRSAEWRSIRNKVILRDMGCDLGLSGYEIRGRILIHPISVRDIVEQSEILLNPEYLICVTHNTHNAIHYGDADLLIITPVERKANDTCPWRK